MTEEQRYDQIELYLKGKMSDKDLKSFESELSSDPELKQQVEVQKVGRLTVQADYMNDMKSKLKDASRAHKKSQTLKWYLSGGFVLITALTFVFWPKAEQADNSVVETKKPDPVDKHFPNEKIVKIDSQVTHVVHHFKAENASNHEVDIETITDEELPSKIVITDTVAEGVYVFETTPETTPEKINVPEPEVLESEVENEEPTKKTEVLKPHLKFRIKESNYDVENGRIDVTYSGDVKLDFKLQGDERDYSSSTHFDEMREGYYSIIARDKAGNEFVYDGIEVKQSACFEKTDYVFNITYDDNIVLPVGSEYQGLVMIMDRSGNQVFTKEFNKLNELTWDGMTTYGQPSSVGLHKVIIKHTHGETCAYNVLIEK